MARSIPNGSASAPSKTAKVTSPTSSACSRDISKLKEVEEGLERLAFYDALTGLPNRLLFRERLESSLKAARRSDAKLTAVRYLDLDKFKPVNDTYGHTTGDALLQEIARRLDESVCEVDTVARLGRDEFAIVLHEVTDAAIPQRIAEKMIAAINEPVFVEGHNCHFGTSISIAPDHAEHAGAGGTGRRRHICGEESRTQLLLRP